MIVAFVSGIAIVAGSIKAGWPSGCLASSTGFSPHVPVCRGAARRNAVISTHRGDETVCYRHWPRVDGKRCLISQPMGNLAGTRGHILADGENNGNLIG